MLMQITKSCSSDRTAPGAKISGHHAPTSAEPDQRVANQHGVVPRRIQPAIHRIMQRNAGQRAPALQQQVLVEHKVAFVGGGQNWRSAQASRPVPVLGSVMTLIVQQDPPLCCRALEGVAVGSLNRLVQIGKDIANILDAHREPHQLRRNAGRGLLLD